LEDQSLDALWVGGCEDDRRDPSRVSPQDRGSFRIDSVEDHQHVFVGLLEQRHVKRVIPQIERIRCSGTALVEQDEAAVGGKTPKAVLVLGLVPHEIDAR
jgi:hypothetical protein